MGMEMAINMVRWISQGVDEGRVLSLDFARDFGDGQLPQ